MRHTSRSKDDPVSLPRIPGKSHAAIKRVAAPVPANCHPASFLNSWMLPRRRTCRMLPSHTAPRPKAISSHTTRPCTVPASTHPKPRYYLRAELLQTHQLDHSIKKNGILFRTARKVACSAIAVGSDCLSLRAQTPTKIDRLHNQDVARLFEQMMIRQAKSCGIAKKPPIPPLLRS
jgi:hypothetical protein